MKTPPIKFMHGTNTWYNGIKIVCFLSMANNCSLIRVIFLWRQNLLIAEKTIFFNKNYSKN